MNQIFGDEWWCEIPQKPNPKYEYLLRILRAVKAGLAASMAVGQPEVVA
jgi:hypothetical protein